METTDIVARLIGPFVLEARDPAGPVPEEAVHAMVEKIDLPLGGNLVQGVGGDIHHIKPKH